MLEAVLPLVEKDLDRVALLRESLDRHGNALGTRWVVVPGAAQAAIERAFADDARWTVIDEREVVGRRPPHARSLRGRLRGRGQGNWYLQQVIKLAACASSTADFCITLDADVIALREVSGSTVAPGGRAWVQIEPPPQAHPHWYDGAARVLGLPRSSLHHAVTPVVYSPVVCRDLISHLESRSGVLDRNWIGYLMRHTPWAEQTLYHTFLEGTGRFDEFHVRAERPVLYGDAVWYPEDFSRWRGGRIRDEPLFTLVQSTAGVPVETIRRHLEAQQ